MKVSGLGGKSVKRLEGPEMALGRWQCAECNALLSELQRGLV